MSCGTLSNSLAAVSSSERLLGMPVRVLGVLMGWYSDVKYGSAYGRDLQKLAADARAISAAN